MEIRKARADEAQAVSELASSLFPLACPPGMPRSDMDAYISTHLTPAHFEEFLASDDAIVSVADDGGQLVGYTLVFTGGEGAKQEPEFGVTLESGSMLSKLYVRESHHGKGIALMLFDAVKQDARDLGLAGVWLNVNNVNFRAQRFYEKHGFTHCGWVNFVVGDTVQRDPVYEYRFA